MVLHNNDTNLFVLVRRASMLARKTLNVCDPRRPSLSTHLKNSIRQTVRENNGKES